ncbi:uncharacterized protein LOC110861220 [Folsomia candida]|uniref:uncharacterized protein LOC110861220 n=1 Tax=Folsomia candida TaxID=158441 RepID=UPI000B8F8B56|nr:uncharacterized protein LOC110861220 [Folsomia candida]
MQFNKMGKTCCCTLQQGTAIIGTLCIVGSILTVIVNSFWINTIVSNERIKPQKHYGLFLILPCIGIVSGVVSFILGSLMVYGSIIRNRRFIIPWLVCSYVIVVLLLVVGAMGTFNVVFYGEMDHVEQVFLVIFSGIIQTYFISVVNRFVTELKAEADN